MNLHDALVLGQKLMLEHNLTFDGWQFQFDNSKRRFGVCKYGLKIISLSKYLVQLNDEDQVKDTILHEIAHALTPGDGHGSKWKKKCVEIGCRPVRCYDTKRDNVIIPKGKYEAVCSACKKVHTREKKVPTGRLYACNCQSHKPWSQRLILVFHSVVEQQNKISNESFNKLLNHVKEFSN